MSFKSVIKITCVVSYSGCADHSGWHLHFKGEYVFYSVWNQANKSDQNALLMTQFVVQEPSIKKGVFCTML